MLLDAGNPIAQQASHVWRATVLTTITAMVICLSLVTLHPAHSAENGDQRLPVSEAFSDANSSELRPAPAAPDSIPAAHIVAFGITLVQVDNTKLAGRETSLAKLVDAACGPARKSKSKDGVVAGHMPAERAQNLIEDIKARDAGTIIAEPRISAVFEANPIYPSPADYPGQPEAANAARHKDVCVQSGGLLITLHAQPIDRGTHEPIRLKVSADVEFKPQADTDSSTDRNLQVLSTLMRKVSYAAQLQLGDSLVIACGMSDRNPATNAELANLILVIPLTVTPVTDSNSHAAQSQDVEALRKVVKELKAEIRGLRQQSPQAHPEVAAAFTPDTSANRSTAATDAATGEAADHDADRKILLAEEAALQAKNKYDYFQRLAKKGYVKQSQADTERLVWEKAKSDLAATKRQALKARDIGNNGDNIERKLLLLDVKEAKVDYDAAQAAYDAASALHAKGALSDSELAVRKLALQKAEIVKQRIELILKSSQPPAVDPEKGSSELDHGGDALEKQKLNIKNLESQLEAAKTQIKPQLEFLSRYSSTQTAGSPAGFNGSNVGLQFSAPLGLRNAEAQVRSAELRLKQAKAVLAAMELENNPEPKENPPQPDIAGAATRDNKAEERQIVLNARIVEVPDSSLQQIQATCSTVGNANRFFADFASGKESTLAGILDLRDTTVLNELLDADKNATVVVDSRVTVRSGHTARFLSKSEIAVISPADKDASGSDSTTFRGAGASLTVVVMVQDRDLIRLQIVPEFSDVDPETTVNGIPGVNIRRVQTTVELRAGQTVALPGPQLSTDANTRILILVTPENIRPLP